MGRWEPDAQGRMRLAALELYLDPGFEQTTVADIAERAGVTERTFFRYFTDKREVLFDATGQMEHDVLAVLAATDPSLPALDAAGRRSPTVRRCWRSGASTRGAERRRSPRTRACRSGSC